MNIQEIRKKSVAELRDMLSDLYRELFNLRMQKAMEKQPRPHLIKQARRTIAKIKTVIQEAATNG